MKKITLDGVYYVVNNSCLCANLTLNVDFDFISTIVNEWMINNHTTNINVVNHSWSWL